MSYTVHVVSAAELDIAEAIDWYESQRAGLGEEFLSEFEAVIDLLEQSPLIYQETYRGSRRVVMHRFPYLVWFVVARNIVTVVACVHGKINPAVVQNRLG